MADTTSIVKDDAEPDGDGMALTRVATQLGEGVPLRCFEKTLYDGRETIPAMMIPRGVQADSLPIYKRFTMLGPTNLARVIVDTVVNRQRPNGFRMVNDRTMRSTMADDVYRRSHMALHFPKCAHDVGMHGRSYLYVPGSQGMDDIQRVSPWNAYVSEGRDVGCMYSFNEVEQRERLTLLRLVRNEDGTVKDVYARSASRESETRTLVKETDSPTIEDIAKTWDSDTPATWKPSNDFTWDGAAESIDYAREIGELPLIPITSPDGQSFLYPHFGSFLRIDNQIYDRLCIETMQAFRQRAVKGDLPTAYSADDPAVAAGLKEEGDPIDYSGMFETGVAAMWLLPRDVDIWESATTDLTPLETIIQGDVKRLAAATSTPIEVLSPDVQGSAEGAKLKTSNLVLKVEALNALADDSMVRALRMALRANGQQVAEDQAFETMWQPPEQRDWAQVGQATANMKGVFPAKTIWRQVAGFNEQEMAEAEQDLTDVAFQTALANENQALASKTQDQQSQIDTTPDLSTTGLADMDTTGFTDTANTPSPTPNGVTDGIENQ